MKICIKAGGSHFLWHDFVGKLSVLKRYPETDREIYQSNERNLGSNLIRIMTNMWLRHVTYSLSHTVPTYIHTQAWNLDLFLGAKFLWWTWHDTDAPIRHRILGVPVGSSAWVITFTGTFQLLIRLFILKNPKSITKGIIINVALTTLIMMVQMAFFQLISGDEQGLPSQKTLIAVISGYTLAVIVGFATKGQQRPSSNPFVSYPSFDNLPRLGLTLYFAFLALNMAFANPEAHLSTGVHQTIGPCDVMERDLAGQLRQVYLCPDTHTQDWTFDTTG